MFYSLHVCHMWSGGEKGGGGLQRGQQGGIWSHVVDVHPWEQEGGGK